MVVEDMPVSVTMIQMKVLGKYLMTPAEKIEFLQSTQSVRNLAMNSRQGGSPANEYLAEAVYKLSETVDKVIQHIPISNDRRNPS